MPPPNIRHFVDFREEVLSTIYVQNVLQATQTGDISYPNMVLNPYHPSKVAYDVVSDQAFALQVGEQRNREVEGGWRQFRHSNRKGGGDLLAERDIGHEPWP